MKSKSILFVTLFSLFIGNSACDPEEVCQATYLADLALETFNATYEGLVTDPDGTVKEYYTIGHTLINVIKDIAGCETNAQTAGANRMFRRITFSDNPNFSNPTVVQQKHFDVNELVPGATGLFGNQLAFLQNGYYLFHSTADSDDVVDERNENNNEDDKPLERSSSINYNNVIHVTRASDRPIFDANGERIYFETISTIIKYE
jgi:hypothetical protein